MSLPVTSKSGVNGTSTIDTGKGIRAIVVGSAHGTDAVVSPLAGHGGVIVAGTLDAAKGIRAVVARGAGST